MPIPPCDSFNVLKQLQVIALSDLVEILRLMSRLRSYYAEMNHRRTRTRVRLVLVKLGYTAHRW